MLLAQGVALGGASVKAGLQEGAVRRSDGQAGLGRPGVHLVEPSPVQQEARIASAGAPGSSSAPQVRFVAQILAGVVDPAAQA